MYCDTEYGIEHNSWIFIYRERTYLHFIQKSEYCQLCYTDDTFISSWHCLFWPDTILSWQLKVFAFVYFNIFLRQGEGNKLCWMCVSWRISFRKTVLLPCGFWRNGLTCLDLVAKPLLMVAYCRYHYIFFKACYFVCIHTDIHKNSAHSSWLVNMTHTDTHTYRHFWKSFWNIYSRILYCIKILDMR